MAECIWCGKRSLFLKVNEESICEKCWDDLHKRTGKYGFNLREKLIITDAFVEIENSFLGARPNMHDFFFALETDTISEIDLLKVATCFLQVFEIENELISNIGETNTRKMVLGAAISIIA